MKTLTLTALLAISSVHAATYTIDPNHTNARFAIDHFGTSTNHAGIYKLQGKVEYDPSAQTGQIDIHLPVANIDSGVEGFNNHLKSADILDAEKYPEITFSSTKFNFDGDKVNSVEGNLTLHGQTHPVTLTATKFNCYNSPKLKTQVCGGDFTTTIDRSQWGVNFLIDAGFAKDVNIDIQVEAALEK